MLKAQSHRSKGTRKWNNTLIWQLGIGLVVLVLISAALTAGKYLSQRSTESRSQAAGKQWFCLTYEYANTNCSEPHIYTGPRRVIISEANPSTGCMQTSQTRSNELYCWEEVNGGPEGDGNVGPCRPEYSSFCQDPSANRTNSYLCKCVALSGGSNGTPITYGWNCATEDPIKCPVQGSGSGSTGTNSSPYPIGGGTGGSGGGNGGSGGGSTGGTGGGGSNPWGARSISGKVVCSVNNQAIANVPVAAYVGTNSGPGNVIKSGKTAGNGQYTLALDGQNERFTVRVMAGANSKDHDYAFKRSGNPGITCIDNNAFELCRYLEIPVGTTKTGFDYTTAAQATNLRGSQQVGNLFVFQFNQARDVRGGYLKQYVVRLDNKADGWYNANSDYYVRVPKEGSSGVGTCSGGVCRITSSELNAIRPFKLGTYSMGVNPISNHQVSGQPIIELCRTDATVVAAFTNAPPTAPTSVQPCGNGWGTCRATSQGAVTGSTTCYTGAQSTNNYNEWNCCPAGFVILNGRCAKVGKLTPN